MTREEAMNVLKANYPDPCFSDLRKAVNMAIKALEEVEIMRCKDCMYCDQGWCDYLETSMGINDFCSRAKRKTDEYQ